MEERKIYNSSNKSIGELKISDDQIEIINFKNHNMNLVISEHEIISCAKSGVYNEDIIKKLYDDYTLLVGEIAAIFNVLYHRANKWIKELYGECNKKGRRNSSFGVIFSKQRRSNMSAKKQLFFKNGGKPNTYIRTPEIKQKISDGVKKARQEGRLPDPKQIALDAWKNGKFNNVNFKRGIGGFFYSFKNKKKFFFRSLFELYYLIILEEDNNIKNFSYENIIIPCDDGTSYTPDFRVGDEVQELKSYDFVYKQGGKIQERFEYKVGQATKYCAEHGLQYRVIFDKDFNFNSKAYKHYLNDHPEVINKYCIEFLQPERVGLKSNRK